MNVLCVTKPIDMTTAQFLQATTEGDYNKRSQLQNLDQCAEVFYLTTSKSRKEKVRFVKIDNSGRIYPMVNNSLVVDFAINEQFEVFEFTMNCYNRYEREVTC